MLPSQYKYLETSEVEAKRSARRGTMVPIASPEPPLLCEVS